MKLCSHVIRVDTGLAPNPFHVFCTSALCTPSHMNARLQQGDWLIGNSPKRDGNRLVYAMRISEVLNMDDYFCDPPFLAKRPNPHGSPEDQCGDNFYYQQNGAWRRLPSRFHNDQESFMKDLGRNLSGKPVFVASHFYYFGENRVAIPEGLTPVIRRVQGIQYVKSPLAALKSPSRAVQASSRTNSSRLAARTTTSAIRPFSKISKSGSCWSKGGQAAAC